MPTLTLEAHPLRCSIDTALGASITDFSLMTSDGSPVPIFRRAAPSITDPAHAASFPMAPWTNRIADARFTFAGTEHTLRPNFPDRTAIHGTARDAPWRITDRTPVSARLVYDSRTHETANFPFPFACVQRFELCPDHLLVELSITNLSDAPIPASLGHHPFINRHLLSATEDPILQAQVATRYPAEHCLPTAPAADDEHCQRLRAGAPLANHALDDVFTGFTGRATIDWPDSRVRMTIDCSDAFSHLVVFTPASPSNPESPHTWFCVEPCSAVNNAVNLTHLHNTGLVTLEPGTTLESAVRYHIERL